MNDFTKEELEQLYHCAKFVTEYNWLHDRYDGLMKKIQSLMENYCDHSRHHTTRDTTYCELCYKEI